jgi:hypothetical protein
MISILSLKERYKTEFNKFTLSDPARSMKRRSSIIIITGIAIAAIISVIAVSTHLRLSALEPEGHGDETAEEIAQEILTGPPAYSEEKETRENDPQSEEDGERESGESHSEAEETAEERAAEGK